ncbi:MAG TPA: Uma2 family endonuclease [Opitutaceae bacterium]|nr:Uma2 family endonuclease [Opitutaceae bacterium]
MTDLVASDSRQPPGSAPEPRLTAADYRRTPEGPPWFELVGGALLAEPSPTSWHQHASGELFLELGLWCRRTGAGRVFAAPLDVYLSEHDVLQPDLLFIARERLTILREDGVHGPPDLVVEVLSPSNAVFVRTRKRAAYAYGRVPEFWLVDPKIAAVHVYDFERHPTIPVRFVGLGEALASPRLPGFGMAVKELFRAR